jgi:hypothetical protein
MRKRISVLMLGLMLAVTMAFYGVAFAKVSYTNSNPPGGGGGQTCTATTGNGVGGGTDKGSTQGSCSNDKNSFPK